MLMNNGFNIHSHVFHLIIAIIDDEPGINSDVTVHNAHKFLDVFCVLLSLENLLTIYGNHANLLNKYFMYI